MYSNSSVLSLPAHNQYTWSTGDSSNAITALGQGVIMRMSQIQMVVNSIPILSAWL